MTEGLFIIPLDEKMCRGVGLDISKNDGRLKKIGQKQVLTLPRLAHAGSHPK